MRSRSGSSSTTGSSEWVGEMTLEVSSIKSARSEAVVSDTVWSEGMESWDDAEASVSSVQVGISIVLAVKQAVLGRRMSFVLGR